MDRKAILFCLLVYCGFVHGVIVTPFTNCSTCSIRDVHWPSSTEYVMLLTDFTLYKSGDEGQHWWKILSSVIGVFSYDSDPKSMLFWTTSGFATTSDGGTSIVTRSFPVTSVSQVGLHPNMVGWLLILSCSGTCTMYYSKTFGATWTTGPNNFRGPPLAWGRDPATPDTFFGLDSQNRFGFYPDYTTWTYLFERSIGFVLTSHFLFVGVLIAPGSANLYSSSIRDDITHTRLSSYNLDVFTFGNTLPEQGYTFLDDTTRSEFIGVKQTNPNYGNLFSSEFDGDSFTLSLEYMAASLYNYDFDIFHGLPGIYVVNGYPNSTGIGKQTVITYDNGGEWRNLQAPSVDMSGSPIDCQLSQGCALHLQGILSWISGIAPPYYSSANAIGLMVAVGNIGTSVSSDRSTWKTYFTRDAGLTWIELFNAPTIYEYGDHGGILTFSVQGIVTNRVYFSVDEGRTLCSFIFTNTPIFVDNIFIEPSGTGRKFVLIGHSNSPYIPYIFGLDFSENIPAVCADADYEYWSPSDREHGDLICFMGSNTVYKRRKQVSPCYNDRDTDHIVSQTSCACAFEDYECDIGFSPSLRNSTDGFSCTAYQDVPSCATGYRLIPDTLCAGGMDLNSQSCPGYSTAGSSVTNAATSSSSGAPPRQTSTADDAQATTGNDSNTGAVIGVTLLFLVLIGGSAAGGALYWKNDNFRRFVLEKLGRQNDPAYARVNVVDGSDETGNEGTGNEGII